MHISETERGVLLNLCCCKGTLQVNVWSMQKLCLANTNNIPTLWALEQWKAMPVPVHLWHAGSRQTQIRVWIGEGWHAVIISCCWNWPSINLNSRKGRGQQTAAWDEIFMIQWPQKFFFFLKRRRDREKWVVVIRHALHVHKYSNRSVLEV